jgi:hypothetical protein
MGPDFRNARLLLDGATRVGDVELHLLTAGWATHRHRENLEYANVILHVALWRDESGRGPAGCAGDRIPELVLEPFLDRPLVELLAAVRERYPEDAGAAPDVRMVGRLLDAAGDEWLQRKVRRFERLLALSDPDEAFYREFMSAMGYSANRAPFEELASIVPWASLKGKSANEIESILRKRSGLGDGAGPAMNRWVWRHRGVRPVNYPERRLKAAAAVLGVFLEGLARGFHAEPERTSTWARDLSKRLHVGSGGLIGMERAEGIVFNVAAPGLIASAKAVGEFEAAQELVDLISTYPAPSDNRATTLVKRELFGAGRTAEADRCVHSVRRHWGLLRWYQGLSG